MIDAVNECALVPCNRRIDVSLGFRKPVQVRRKGIVLAKHSIEFKLLGKFEFQLRPSARGVKADQGAARFDERTAVENAAAQACSEPSDRTPPV